MPIERSADHPIFELGGNAITSYAAPARGAEEVALYRADVPPGGGLPPHTHDHFDVFTVVAGEGIFHLWADTTEVAVGDSVVVPIGVRHFLEAGSEGASLIVAMLPGTRLIRDDGSELVPEWVR
ncbi:MAG: cupin domain-containing protein [Actinomycetota bacterium]